MSRRIPRREFLRHSAVIVGGAAIRGVATERVAGLDQAAASALLPKDEWRNRQSKMRYRRLGRTGFMISQIVCGGDPISPTTNRQVERAIDMGLNYLQTAPGYGDGQSEMGCAKVSEGPKRERVSEIKPIPDDEFQDEAVGAAGQADAGAEVDFPLRPQVEVYGGEDGVLLLTQRLESPDGAEGAVVFDSRRHLAAHAITELAVGGEFEALSSALAV